MKARFFLALIIVLSIVFGAVQAQDFNPCFSLSADDCAAIEEATANTAVFLAGTESFTIDMDISFSAEDIPGEEGETTSMSYSQVGAIDFVMNADAETGINAYGYFDITANDGSEDVELAIEFWLVDDVAYFVDPTTESLYSIDILRLMEEGDFESAMSDPTEALEDLPVDMEALAPALALIGLPGLLDHTRDGDNFVFSIDLGALTDPANAEAIAAVVASVTETDPEAGAQLESYMQLLPMMLETGTIDFTQSLNTELGIVDNFALDGNFVVATGMMMGDPQLPPTTVDLAFNMGLGNFDAVENPTAPEGAEDITDQVLETLGAFMGASEE
jgi:hypothetical protein